MDKEYERRKKQSDNSLRLAISSVLTIIVGIIVTIGLEPNNIKVIGFIIVVIGCLVYLIWVVVYAINSDI